MALSQRYVPNTHIGTAAANEVKCRRIKELSNISGQDTLRFMDGQRDERL